MRTTFNPQDRSNFQMQLVKTPALEKHINSFHFRKQQNNMKNAINIISDYLNRIPGKQELKVDALHPSKANFVKTGTYDIFILDDKHLSKKTLDKFERENIYMQLEGSNKFQGFYMNPDAHPQNIANWFMNAFNYYLKKS